MITGRMGIHTLKTGIKCKKIKKYGVIFLTVLLLFCNTIPASAVTIVDQSRCPYCGEEADLYDDYTMYCSYCGYYSSTWDCGYGVPLYMFNQYYFTYKEDYIKFIWRQNEYYNYLEILDELPEEKINHIINGSSGRDHLWDDLVPDKDWDEIKEIIAEVLTVGEEKEEEYTSNVFCKVVFMRYHNVTVKYHIDDDGTFQMGDAWVNADE